MYDKIIVDIESFLELMEPICLKYRRMDLRHLVFVNGTRLPLTVRCDMGKYPQEFISPTPFHPIVAAGLAKDLILDSFVCDKYRKLMISNPLLPEQPSDNYIPNSKSIDRIITDFLSDDMDHDDIEELVNIADEMIRYLSKFNIPNDRVLDIDIERNYIVITFGENIAYLRLKEAGYV